MAARTKNKPKAPALKASLIKEVPDKEEDGRLIVSGSYKELFYRPTLDGWTPEKVKRAIDGADSGHLLELADLVEAMMGDDRIDGVTSSRTHGLLGLPLTFVAGSEQAKTYLQGENKAPGEWYSMLPESELVRFLAWGIILGVGLAQIVPLPRLPGRKQRYRFETWNPRHLRHDPLAHGGFEWYVQTATGEVPIVPGAGKWALFLPYGVKRPWAGGKWRSLVFPWLLKRFALEDRANHTEVNGSPVWLGKAPQGATEGQRNRFLSQLVGLGKKGRFVLPDGWDLALRESTAKNWEIYSESVSWADTAITIVLAGQVVTTEGSPGFSSGNVQDSIKEDFIRFDAERLSSCTHEQVLIPWAWANFQDDEAAPWPQWQVKRPVDKEQEVRTLTLVGQAVKGLNEELAKIGQRVNLPEYLAQYNVPLEAVPAKDTSATVSIPLAPTDVAKTVTVNEIRRSNGLQDLTTPEGKPDPRGNKLISELQPSTSEILTAPTPGPAGAPLVKEPNETPA